MHQAGRAGLPLPRLPTALPALVRARWALQPSPEDVSASIVRGLSHIGSIIIGFDTSLFSGISARRGGLSTAIEAGVQEAILWMQSGHAADISARRYVSLRSPKLLYRTWEAFRL